MKVTPSMNLPEKIESFQEASLGRQLMSNLRKCGYSTPTPIQKQAIPIILDHRDVIGIAHTGSGKTVRVVLIMELPTLHDSIVKIFSAFQGAFLIPIIHTLLMKSSDSTRRGCVYPRALIISPIRELAIQIWENVRMYAAESALKYSVIYGGVQVRHHVTYLYVKTVNLFTSSTSSRISIRDDSIPDYSIPMDFFTFSAGVIF